MLVELLRAHGGTKRQAAARWRPRAPARCDADGRGPRERARRPRRPRQAVSAACHRHAPRLRAAAECAACAQRMPVERKAMTLAVSSWRRLPLCLCVCSPRQVAQEDTGREEDAGAGSSRAHHKLARQKGQANRIARRGFPSQPQGLPRVGPRLSFPFACLRLERFPSAPRASN